jgi:son of sevenless-like protein
MLDMEEQFISTFFVRAIYDYQSSDPSSLSFQRDSVIEVLTRLDSGWWDGLLGEERGWFPSNYVTIVSLEEAEAEHSTMDVPIVHNSSEKGEKMEEATAARSLKASQSATTPFNSLADCTLDFNTDGQVSCYH